LRKGGLCELDCWNQRSAAAGETFFSLEAQLLQFFGDKIKKNKKIATKNRTRPFVSAWRRSSERCM
jgi:hypothetical protein